MIPALEEVGSRFESGEYFLPEMLIAARAMRAAMEVLRPHMSATDAPSLGRSSWGRWPATSTTSARTWSNHARGRGLRDRRPRRQRPGRPVRGAIRGTARPSSGSARSSRRRCRMVGRTIKAIRTLGFATRPDHRRRGTHQRNVRGGGRSRRLRPGRELGRAGHARAPRLSGRILAGLATHESPAGRFRGPGSRRMQPSRPGPRCHAVGRRLRGLPADRRTWVHLRLCLTCGHVGCCDQSAGRHATAHWQDLRPSDHPVVRAR